MGSTQGGKGGGGGCASISSSWGGGGGGGSVSATYSSLLPGLGPPSPEKGETLPEV